ncbi:MAG: MmcQ/YjbR family DNA-binding protein [Chitinophagaceae bacterium]
MDAESLRDYCIRKAGVTEGFPFGEGILVFKVKKKIFILVSLGSSPLQFNVKTNPEKSAMLREQYKAITPGYHMNKKWWNTVIIEGTVPSNLIRELIDHSYELVVKSLPKKQQQDLL